MLQNIFLLSGWTVPGFSVVALISLIIRVTLPGPMLISFKFPVFHISWCFVFQIALHPSSNTEGLYTIVLNHDDGLTSWYQFLLKCNCYCGGRMYMVHSMLMDVRGQLVELVLGIEPVPLGFEVSFLFIYFKLIHHFTGSLVPIFCVAFLFSFL